MQRGVSAGVEGAALWPRTWGRADPPQTRGDCPAGSGNQPDRGAPGLLIANHPGDYDSPPAERPGRAPDPREGAVATQRPLALESLEEGRRGHPRLRLHESEFYRSFRRCRPPGSPPLAPGRARDFYLAVACASGEEEAWDALRAKCFPTLRAYLLRRGARRDEVDALLDDLPGYLYEVPEGEAKVPRIGTYRGDSTLLTWLVVVSLRFLMRRRGQSSRDRDLPEDDGLPAEGEPTPIASVLRRERARRFQECIHAAWGTLTRRECLAILLKYRDGLRQKEIAEVLGVGEPRVSRILDTGMARIRRGVLSRMRETPILMGKDDESLREFFSDALAREMAKIRPDGL